MLKDLIPKVQILCVALSRKREAVLESSSVSGKSLILRDDFDSSAASFAFFSFISFFADYANS